MNINRNNPLPLAIIIFMLCTCFIISCEKEDDDDNNELTASSYFPLSPGMAWTYRDTTSYGDAYNSTCTIVDTATMDGYETYTWVVEFEGYAPDTSYIQRRSDGIYQLIITDAMSMSRCIGINQSQSIHKIMPNKFSIGSIWQVDSFDTNYQMGTISYHISNIAHAQAMEIENIAVPAGDFLNCLKLYDIRQLSYIIINTESGETIVNNSSSSQRCCWYVSGVGKVKSIEDAVDGLTYISVLTSYSTGK